MFRLNLQFFAHHKGGGSTKNGRDSNAKRLGAKRADGQKSTPAQTLAEAATIRCLPWLTDA